MLDRFQSCSSGSTYSSVEATLYPHTSWPCSWRALQAGKSTSYQPLMPGAFAWTKSIPSIMKHILFALPVWLAILYHFCTSVASCRYVFLYFIIVHGEGRTRKLGIGPWQPVGLRDMDVLSNMPKTSSCPLKVMDHIRSRAFLTPSYSLGGFRQNLGYLLTTGTGHGMARS